MSDGPTRFQLLRSHVRAATSCVVLALACSPDAGNGGDSGTVGDTSTGDTSTGGPGSAEETTSGDATGTTTADPTTLGTDSTGSPGTADGSSSGPSGTATTSDESTSDTGPSVVRCEPDPVPDVCQSAHDNWTVCVYGMPVADDSYLFGCSCLLQLAESEAGETCRDLLEAWFTCVSTAPCMEILLDEHCGAEYSAIADECPEFVPSG